MCVAVEYEQLEVQLDQLDAVLTNIENRRDQLHQEALLLLEEAKELRNKQDKEETDTSHE